MHRAGMPKGGILSASHVSATVLVRETLKPVRMRSQSPLSPRELEGPRILLAGLEATVTEHLGRLGTALEAPMTRLIETASQTPKAAAEVITRLREEMTHSSYQMSLLGFEIVKQNSKNPRECSSEG